MHVTVLIKSGTKSDATVEIEQVPGLAPHIGMIVDNFRQGMRSTVILSPDEAEAIIGALTLAIKHARRDSNGACR